MVRWDGRRTGVQALRELLGGSDHRTLRESACALARRLQGTYGREFLADDHSASIAQLEQFLRCMDPAITTEQHRLDAKQHWQNKLKITDADSNFPARLVLKQLLSGDDRVRGHHLCYLLPRYVCSSM